MMNAVRAMETRATARHMVFARPSERRFLAVSALLFAGSAAATIAWCGSMSAMDEMPMPGGRTMTMAWMPMAGQTWAGAAANFLLMWIVMMMAMMLPSLVPMLSRYREALVRKGAPRVGRLTAVAGTGYFVVWAVFGMAAFPPGARLASLAMHEPAVARVVPIAVGAVVLIAGALQFSASKARYLACCRDPAGHHATSPPTAVTAWRFGLRLGLLCTCCCAGLMTTLMVVGIMDLRAMAAVGVAITAERLAPAGERVARVNGAIGIAAGCFMIARALGLA